MKFTVLVFALGFANLSQACPNLTGNYRCSVFDEEGTIDVTQSAKDGVTTYSFKTSPNFSVFIASDKIIADSKERAAVPTQYMKNAFYKATCNGSTLKTDVKGDLFDEEGGKVASVIATSVLSRLPNGAAQLVVNGQFDNDKFGPETIVCQVRN